MSDDQNKSYQDGLYNQPYNGRNWDQWVAGNNARQGGQNTNSTPYKVAPIQWPETDDSEFTSGARFQTDAIDPRVIFFILLLPVILPCLAFAILVAVPALVAAPVLRLAVRMAGIEEHKSYKQAYVMIVKALVAYAVANVVMGGVAYLFGRFVFAGGVFMHVALYLQQVTVGLPQPEPLSISTLLGIVLMLEVPALAVFAFMLRREYAAGFSGRRGWLRGMAVAAPVVLLTAAILGLLRTLMSF